MRYALIIAGGSGTRLWPMSKGAQPKQLIPFINGKSLLQIAYERLEGLVPADRRYICAGEHHRQVISQALGLKDSQFLGEPMGRDTVNAVGFAAAAIAKRDPDAVIAVFTADHIIEPIAEFQKIVNIGYEIAETQPHSLVTFGISPTAPATGYGYLQLGKPLGANASVVDRFREKPDLASAKEFFAAGPKSYLWNSGMFVWRASTLLECIRRYEPAIAAGLDQIAAAWGTPNQQAKLQEVYPTLKKISVDFAVMEPASKDDKVQVAAVPMALQWLDVGSWPMFAETCPKDENANALGAQKHVLKDTKGTLVASSDPNHLIATIGCEDLIVIHTPEATLVCRADQAERIKELHAEIGKRYGASYQ